MTAMCETPPHAAQRVLFACGRIRGGMLEMRIVPAPDDLAVAAAPDAPAHATQAA